MQLFDPVHWTSHRISCFYVFGFFFCLSSAGGPLRAAVMRYFFPLTASHCVCLHQNKRCSEQAKWSRKAARTSVTFYYCCSSYMSQITHGDAHFSAMPRRINSCGQNADLGTKDVERRRGIDDIMSVGGRCSFVSRENRCSSGLYLQSFEYLMRGGRAGESRRLCAL